MAKTYIGYTECETRCMKGANVLGENTEKKKQVKGGVRSMHPSRFG